MEQLDYMELAKQLNPWIAAAGALIGVIVAWFLNLLTQLMVGWWRRRTEAKTLRLALVAEINGMLGVMEARRYFQGLQAVPAHMQQHQLSHYKFWVKMPDDYCPIYSANVGNIGLLKPKEAAFIVGFHQLILSVIQDVTPGGVLYNGGTAQQFGEAAGLLAHAMEMGEQIVQKYKIPVTL